MGYYTAFNGTRSFEPDDTAECMYLLSDFYTTLNEILDKAKEKWPDGWKDLDIRPEHIHTRCLGYDCYDHSDYDNYFRITRIKE